MANKGVNKVIVLGNIGSVDVRHTEQGKTICNLSIATSEKWKDKITGEPQERTEWHRVVMFNKLAEIAAEYVRKGSKVYIEGQLRTRKWQDNNGQDRYTTEIVANDMQMLDSKPSQNESQTQETQQQEYQRPQQQAYTKVQPSNPAPTTEEFDDDIPF